VSTRTGATGSTFAATALSRLTEAFADAADPDAAVAMRAYMRDQFEFVGIQKAERTAIARAAFAGLGTPSADDLLAFATAAWARPERDHQYVAAKLLRRHVKRLDATAIDDLRTLIITKSWWDTVDELARNVVGPLVRANPELVAVMDRWIDDDDIWLARTAILHQGTFKDATDVDRLFRYCLRRAGDTEFFLRKAIGWALRDYSKVDEAAVRAFVAAHDAELSGLTKREALRYWERVAATEARRAGVDR
jgi:3-methyladenine DNA glycosylase AlkD